MSSPPKKLRKNAAAAAAAASADIIEHGDANADDDMNEDPATMYEDEEGASFQPYETFAFHCQCRIR